jgi:hypothetical protein
MAAAKAPNISRQILGKSLVPLLNEDISDSDLFLIILAIGSLKIKGYLSRAIYYK